MKARKTTFSPLVDKLFQKWISNDTWSTGHPFDDERFYRFVWMVATRSRRPLSEGDFRDLIVTKWQGKLDEEYLQNKALHYSGLYATLLEFVKVKNKPIPILFNQDGTPILD